MPGLLVGCEGAGVQMSMELPEAGRHLRRRKPPREESTRPAPYAQIIDRGHVVIQGCDSLTTIDAWNRAGRGPTSRCRRLAVTGLTTNQEAVALDSGKCGPAREECARDRSTGTGAAQGRLRL